MKTVLRASSGRPQRAPPPGLGLLPLWRPLVSGLLSPSYPTTMAGSGRKNVEEEVATSGVQDRNRDPGRLQGLAASRGGRSEEPAAGSSECPPSFLSPCPLLRFPDSQAHVPAESTRELRKARLPPGQPLGPHADTSRPRKLAPQSPGSARSWRDHLWQRETTLSSQLFFSPALLR